MNSDSSKFGLAVLIGCCIVLCCCVIFLAGTGIFWGLSQQVSQVFSSPDDQVELTPIVIRPSPQALETLKPGIIPTDSLEQLTTQPENSAPVENATAAAPTDPAAQINALTNTETLRRLQTTYVPVSDLIDLAKRFKGVEDIPLTIPAPVMPLQVGAKQQFWLSNEDENRNFQVTARLDYIGEHAYFWVEEGVRYDRAAMEDLMTTFDERIYPTDREFFGSEWTPGIDNDPRIYILYVRNMGSGIAGYFSSSDSQPPQAHPYSNAHEMFDVNADTVELTDEYAKLVLAHEFQHMIQWFQDRNEETWLNEGFSELALLINGYDNSGFDTLFSAEPDIQLNAWPDDADADSSPFYGSSFLFTAYFLDRFGEPVTQALVLDQDNGIDSLDHVFQEMNIQDSLKQSPQTADDFFLDWTLTNYINDSSVGDGRYAYTRYPYAPAFEPTQQFDTCPVNPQVKTVHQYAADYIRFDCAGSYTLHFEGSIQTNVVPADPHSGAYMFWSNRSDESDMTLTRTFDFRNQSGPLTLDYWTWYDLEDGYDFSYLAVSEDGSRWELLKTPSGTEYNPSGSNLGWGYTGKSGGKSKPAWIHERVDLSAYAGKQIQVRFEYITDTAVNRNGFLLDDVAVPELGYFADFEQDDGGWQPGGWARINNILPQNWKLALVTDGNKTTQVEYLTLNPDLSLTVPVKIGGSVESVTLVIGAATRFTTQKASYRYWLDR